MHPSVNLPRPPATLTATRPRVLLVDDEENILASLRRLLHQQARLFRGEAHAFGLFGHQLHEEEEIGRGRAGGGNHAVQAGFAGDPDGLPDRLQHLLGEGAVVDADIARGVKPGHAQADQGRGIRHGPHYVAMAAEQAAQPGDLDAGGDGEHQLVAIATQLAGQRLEHLGHELRLDGQDQHLGGSCCGGIVGTGLNAKLVTQGGQLVLIQIGDMDAFGWMACIEQAADEAASHVAAADKSNCALFH